MKKGWILFGLVFLWGTSTVTATTSDSESESDTSVSWTSSDRDVVAPTVESSIEPIDTETMQVAQQEKLQIQSLNDKQEILRVTYYPSPDENYRGMKFPVWSQNKGQDDIEWIDGNWDPVQKRWWGDIYVKNHADVGKLNVHAYGLLANGSLAVRGGTSIDLIGPSFNGEILSEDPTNMRYSVKISINSDRGTVKEVRVPIWSDSQQKDIVWYQGSLQQDGTYLVHFDFKNHNFNTGNFKTHVYVTNKNGLSTALALPDTNVTQPPILGNLQTTSLSIDERTYRVSLKLNTSVKSVLFPIWSSKNGQDDIRWYQGKYDAKSDSWYVNFRPADHKDFTDFKIHAYYVQKDSMRFIAATDLKLAQPKFISARIDNQWIREGKFRVLFEVQSDSGVKELRVPIWSRSDQSDIKWYSAVRQSDGSYVVDFDYANHDYHAGKYFVHAYLTASNGLQTAMAMGDRVQVEEPKITGNFSYENTSGKYNSYRVKAKLSAQVKKVLFPTWSEMKGQDDISWYPGIYDPESQSWYADIPIKNHVDAGKMIVHVYYERDKKLAFMAAESFLAPRPTFEKTDIDSSQANQGKINLTFRLTAPAGIKELKVPIWCNANQSDIVWYQAKSRPDGTYQVEMDFKNHHYHTGIYKIHAYLTDKNGTTVGKVISNGIEVTEPKLSASKIQIQDIDGNGHSYQVSAKLSKIPETIKQVLFPVWSDEKGQDDIRWYQARYNSAKDEWQTIVNSAYHRDGQKINIHLYADVAEKGMLGLQADSLRLPNDRVMKYINHRGNHREAPENSIPAFEKSDHWGIETDIQLTKDRQWVIMHDDTIDRMTNGSGRIADLTLQQLRQFRFDNGANINRYSDREKVIPTLADFLAICRRKGKVPIIEIKTNQINASDYNQLATIIRDYGFTAEGRVISFYLEPLRQIKARIPELQTLYLTGEINSETIQQAKSIGSQSGLNVLWTSVNKQNVTEAHQNGLSTGAWTVPMTAMPTIREAGVDYFTTDE